MVGVGWPQASTNLRTSCEQPKNLSLLVCRTGGSPIHSFPRKSSLSLRRSTALTLTVRRDGTWRTSIGGLVSSILEEQCDNPMGWDGARGEVANGRTIVRMHPQILLIFRQYSRRDRVRQRRTRTEY